MNFLLCTNVKPEDHEIIASLLDKFVTETVTEKRAMTSAERSKKYRENKKLRDENVMDVTENVTEDKEKKEEKEESFPPSSPLSLPSSPLIPPINYPIPPIIPPSQEEKGEVFVSAAAENTGSDVTDSGEKMPFGNFVKLTNSEYDNLVQKFGAVKVDEMIERMDCYIGEDPKRQKKYETRNHYLTLLNWERMNQERKAQPLQQKPQQKSWTELAKEIEAGQQGEVVDL